MTLKEIKNRHKDITYSIFEGRLSEAFEKLEIAVLLCKNIDYRNRLEKYLDTYKNILKYSFEYQLDPEREKIYSSLIKSLLILNDEIREEIICNNQLLSYSIKKQDVLRIVSLWGEKEGQELIEEIFYGQDLTELLKGTETNISKEVDEAVVRIFEILWLSDKYSDIQNGIINEFFAPKRFSWYHKSLLISAIILSSLRYFDPQKIILLFTIYEQKEEQLWQRAFVGFFLSLMVYGKRIEQYPEILNRLKAYSSDEDFSKQTEQVIIQFLKSKETEKISKKIREDILPHMVKIKTKLDEKLDLDNILSVEQFEDKNPEWKKVFEDTPDLYDKFEEFSMMQMEGSDVFLSAFAMLKRFPFFNKMSNWFVPFYHQNEVLDDIIQEKEKGFDTGKFVEGIERSAFLCNSDKYSFCLNIKYMPTLQKSMMLEMFNMEMKAMNEVSEEDEKLNKNVKSKKVFTQYFQDLYRFYKLHPFKNEFEDVFNIDIEINTDILLKYLVKKETIIRNIAEYYFEKEYFEKAMPVFESLAEKENSQELFEKIGYAYQKQNDYIKAIDYYQRATLFDNEKMWLLKKLAFCNRKLKRFDEALKLYKRLEKFNPEDFHIQANLGHTYMELENYEEAQKYYFKVEYLAKDNFKVFRPIAWSSFVIGKFNTAKKYFEKVIKKEPSADDFLNLGHVEWCMGNAKAAIENYKVAKEKAKNDKTWLSDQFKNDKTYLEKHGIESLDIKLMEDYIAFANRIDQ